MKKNMQIKIETFTTKPFYFVGVRAFIFSLLWLSANHLKATQLSGTYTINPGKTATSSVFNDFSSAITYMTSTNSRADGGPSNTGTVGVSGAITFNVAAGTTYSLSAALVINAISGVSSSNTISFKKYGSGADPVITGYQGSGTNDGMIILIGASYITFDGIDLADDPSNTTSTTQMEWGYCLLRTSTPVGCQYITIQNCTISLNRTNSNTIGIYGDVYTWSSGSLSSISSPSSISGTNSYNGFYGNTITNCFTPVMIRGYISGSSGVDLNNDFGSKGGNIITSFGYQSNSSPYGNFYTGCYVNGIYFFEQGGTYLIENNTVTLTPADGVSTLLNGISSIAYSVAVTGSNPVIKNNSINLYTTASSGLCVGIANNQGTGSSVEDVENNTISFVDSASSSSASFIGINEQSTITSGKYILNGNEVKNCILYGTGYFYGMSTQGGGNAQCTFSYSGNKIHDNIKSSGSSGDMRVLDFSVGSVPMTEANNLIFNNKNNTGNLYGIYHTATTSTEYINNNAIYGLSSNTSNTVAGIYLANSNTTRNIYLDSLSNFTTKGGSVYGIEITTGATANVYRNKMYFSSGATAGIMLINISSPVATPSLISNNFISIGGTSNTSYGIYESGAKNLSFCFNSIYITNTVLNNAGFYVNISGSSSNIKILDNCVSNTGGGFAIWCPSGTAGGGLARMDYNNWYVTGAYLGIWSSSLKGLRLKNWQSLCLLDSHSVSLDPKYVSNIDLHVKSQSIARTGIYLSTVTNDIDGNPRHPAPTIGANEIPPFKDDIGVLALLSPYEGDCGDSNMSIVVNIKNFGTDTQSNIKVIAVLSGPTSAGTYSQTLTPKLAYDSTETAILTNSLNTAAGGTYTLKVYTSLKTDNYRVNDTINTVFTIFSISPQPKVTGGSVCHYGTTKLYAYPTSKNDSIYWYYYSSGGTSIGEGDTFTTPPINSSVTFYAQERFPLKKYHIGPKDYYIGNAAYGTAPVGLKFNALTALTIDSATIYPFLPGTNTVYINLIDSTGKMIKSIPVTVYQYPYSSPNPPPIRIPIGLNVSKGNGYYIYMNDSAVAGVIYNSTGASYPYSVSGIASITGPLPLASSSMYCGLYNIVLHTGNCGSVYVPVQASMSTPSPTLKIDPGSAGSGGTGNRFYPDKICAGSSLVYDLSVSNLDNATYGSKWIISSKSLTFLGGAVIHDTSSIRPSSLGPGKFTFNTKTSYGDSIFILKMDIKTLGNNSCDSIIVRYITVTPIPVVKYIFTNACLGTPIRFTDSSNIAGNGSITGQNWDFGDGQTSALTNPSHSYAKAGTYAVTLTSTSDQGCKVSQKQTVNQYPIPVAKFGAVTGCQNYATVFKDSSTIASGTIAAHQWYFGAGATSSLQNPTYVYLKSGPYIVKMVVTSSFGCKDSVTSPIRVEPQPKAAFGFKNACVGTPIYIGNTSSDSTSGTLYLWNFGDGTTSIKNVPVHTYSKNGSYKIKLTATSKSGCVDTAVQIITPYAKPDVNFYYSGACTNNAASFGDTSGTAADVTFAWNFGDGTSEVLDSNTANHIFTKASTYSVSLIIQNSGGCKDTQTQSVVVSDYPLASFSAPDVCFGKATVFTNKSTPTGLSYAWNFGDSTKTSTSTSPSHVYASPGHFLVKLAATNTGGCTDTASIGVNVAPIPSAIWTMKIHNLKVAFTPADTTQKYYKWYFGSGDSSASKKPVYTYNAKGKYLVKLIVSNGTGCTSIYTDSIAVGPTGINPETEHSALTINIFPNPFEYKTNIGYNLLDNSKVNISVYDMNGKLVATIRNGSCDAGQYMDEFDASKYHAEPGVYLLKMSINNEVYTSKIVINR